MYPKLQTVTVVTAYYNIPSKFTSDTYWKWISNLCKIPCNLIIFTSQDLQPKFEQLRKDHMNTRIITLEFDKLHHYQYIDEYREHLKMDFYKKHSPELYIIWAEKVKFVMNAIKSNPFSSDKFIWCDIGAVREPKFMNVFQNFPQYDKVVDDKMTFLLLSEPSSQDFIPDDNGIIGKKYEDPRPRLGGGIHGGDITSWTRYDKLWDETLQRYFKARRFAGQDQCIMYTIVLEHQDLFHIVRPKIYGGDPWFYLLYHWSKTL